VSNARGRIGEGGRSKRGGFKFKSERFFVRTRPKPKRAPQKLEYCFGAWPVVSRCFSRQCQRDAERWATVTEEEKWQFPFFLAPYPQLLACESSLSISLSSTPLTTVRSAAKGRTPGTRLAGASRSAGSSTTSYWGC
jgi:hypothetical protein